MYRDFYRTILGAVLVALRKKATIARLALRDQSNEAGLASQGETVRVTHVKRPTVEDMTAQVLEQGNIKPAETTVENMTLDIWRKVEFDMTDRDAQAIGQRAYGPIVQTYSEALADDIERNIFTAALAGASHITDLEAKKMTADQLVDVRKAMVKRDGLPTMPVAILNPDSHADLLVDPDFNRADYRGSPGERTSLDGNLGRKFGYDFFESNNIPSFGAVAGAPQTAGQAAAGQRTVAYDGGNAAGIPVGAILTRGSQVYSVEKGAVGAGGTITLNRDIAAAIPNDQALSFRGAHDDDLYFDPMAIAVAFRPTMLPIPSGGTFGAITDPETGFTIMLETIRLSGATRWRFTYLMGVKNVWQDKVQRVVRDA